MNQWVLIGHRGVGKTSLLNQLKSIFPKISFFSLDEEIEKRKEINIKDYFENRGEAAFRQLEVNGLKQLLNEQGTAPFVIDLGAGFQGDIPEHLQAIWVRRLTNPQKAIFNDRPALDGALTMASERFAEREKRYSQQADITITLRQGPDFFQKGERLFFEALFEKKKCSLLKDYRFTLNEQTSPIEKQVLQLLGVGGFEYRDDLVKFPPSFSTSDIQSFRHNEKVKAKAGLWDWPLEWGENPQAPIHSLHQKNRNLSECIQRLSQTKSLRKLAVPIENFQELKLGHQWMMSDPKRNIFLPWSESGRWRWYRLLQEETLKVNFLRLSQGSAPDQPTVFEALNNQISPFFAAVLGAPVDHSFSPTFHQIYFQKKGSPFYSITIFEDEFNEAIPFLQLLGLRWAAVTSPLKQQAAKLIDSPQAINTLIFDGYWQGCNTDGPGFEEATQGIISDNVAVWGGGGTLQSVQSRFEHASFYSSRTGQLKTGSMQEAPQVLVWAVGADSFEKMGVMPPKTWPIKKVIDLNYTQDSPGLACAHMYGCQYQSGLVMFKAQALKQQEYWNEFRIK